MARYQSFPTSIRLTPQLKHRLQKQADRRGHHVATLIVWIVEQWLQQQESRGNRLEISDDRN